MLSKAVRLHGAGDLRLDEFELPAIKDDEILVKVVVTSLSAEVYKSATLGERHKRVHSDVADHPAILGDEFAGEIVEVGAKYADKYKPGMKFSIRHTLDYKGTMWSPGYSYEYCGGNSTYCILASEIMETGNLFIYDAPSYYTGALSESLSYIIGAFNESYHTNHEKHEHHMGIKKGGKLALISAAGVLGMEALIYAISREEKPSLIVITDNNQDRLDQMIEAFSKEKLPKEHNVEIHFINPSTEEEPTDTLLEISDGYGFDDVFCFEATDEAIEQSSDIIGSDGCLNFCADLSDGGFSSLVNFHDVRYNSTHIIGIDGGLKEDLVEALEIISSGESHLGMTVSHIGGLSAAADAILALPKISCRKKIIYPHIDMPLVALSDLKAVAKETKDDRYSELAKIVKSHGGIWSAESEQYLLENF